MKIVDIRNIRSVSTAYYDIEQPMYVYHCNEELKNYVIQKQYPQILITNFADYHNFLVDNKIDINYDTSRKFVDVRQYNVWIQTTDKYIPETAEIDGTIKYKIVDGKYAETDSCWVKLYKITPTSNRHILFTSSGVHTVGINKWEITAAVRSQFLNEKDSRRGKGREEAYQKALDGILSRKKPDTFYLKLAFAFFMPSSPTFLDVDKSVHSVYGQKVKSADRYKLFETQAFRKAIMDVMKIFSPELKKEFQESFNTKKMAEMAGQMWGTALDQKDVNKMMNVFDKINSIGYEEVQATTGSNLLPPGMAPLPSMQSLESTYEDNNSHEKTDDELKEIKAELAVPSIVSEKPSPTIAEIEGFVDEPESN